MTYLIKALCTSVFIQLFIVSFSGYAQLPGDLDITFGTNGIVTHDVSSLNDETIKVRLQNDNKILCLGKTQTGWQNDDIFILRLLPSGELDYTFGQNGVVLIEVSQRNDVGTDMILQNDGKILIVGYTTPPNNLNPLLIRLLPNGQLDDAFGNNGLFTIDIGLLSTLQRVELLQDDNILCLGQVGDDVAVFKFLSDGSLDISFGDGGKVILDTGSDYYTGTDLVVAEDTGFFVCGSSGISATEANALVCKFQSDGSLDQSFNLTGYKEFTVDQSYLINQASRISLIESNGLLVAGNLYESGSSESFVTRILSNGSIDITFGNSGFFNFDNGAGYDLLFDMIPQPNGKILLGGKTAGSGSDYDFFVLRTTENGSLDPTFGNNGVVITEVSPDDDGIADMELQADGKLVVAGTARVGTNDDIALARYHTGINTSVAEISTESKLSVYPNPAINQLTLVAENKLKNVQLLDAMGKTVLVQTVNSSRVIVDLSEVPSGIYLLRATDDKHTLLQKVVKE